MSEELVSEHGERQEPLTVLVANPSPDVYGSDLQMLQSVDAMTAAGWRVVVSVPEEGPLCARLRDAGAEVVLCDFPVLRRSYATPSGLVRLAAAAARALPRMQRLLRRVRPAVVYVNTVTLPWWLLAARSARTPAICHVHEAEVNDRPLVRKVLTAPLRMATALVVVSRSTMDAVCDVEPRLRTKAHLIFNCVSEPETPPAPRTPEDHWRLVVVGRLSPRKAPHVAVEATALLRRRGRDVRLELCGSSLGDHASYVEELRRRAAEPDLAGAVELSGYASPVWPALARADVLLAPSLGESFGLAVVEAQLALRPVVATAVQGHTETVTDGRSGLLVPLEDATAFADAVERLMDDPELVRRLVENAAREARERFSVPHYRAQVLAVLGSYARRTARRPETVTVRPSPT